MCDFSDICIDIVKRFAISLKENMVDFIIVARVFVGCRAINYDIGIYIIMGKVLNIKFHLSIINGYFA